MISARVVRRIVIGVCVIGIAGMIVTSALDHTGAAVTFGLLTAVAILCSMVATAVAADALAGDGHPPATEGHDDPPPEVLAATVEEQVLALVADGADEAALRQVVGEAVRLGRTLRRPRS